ncbi:MAG: hypothetical protein IJL21_02625 [Alphaproteobacteria bacterium]|nr:hypothetical protein [Alphaproteobacteria bacterium]
MKRSLLCCIGESGSGKTTWINNLPDGLFYNLRSYTTRTKRKEEKEGEKYFFVDETKFNSEKLVTKLWVNQYLWTPESGKPKWLYGVPEFEILNHIGENLIYDVIEPRYAQQMIDWINAQKFASDYNIKTAWFVPPVDDDIIKKRANMPDDERVRTQNTCNIFDIFKSLGHKPDFILQPRCNNYDPDLVRYIGALYSDYELMKLMHQKEHETQQRHG